MNRLAHGHDGTGRRAAQGGAPRPQGGQREATGGGGGGRPGWGAIAIGVALALGASAATRAPAAAQTVRDVFQSVTPSVVVIRAKGGDVTSAGQTRFSETGSGVLVTDDGKVMTAAHVVHAMDEIVVEFICGGSVPARVVSSEPAADLSLLQL